MKRAIINFVDSANYEIVNNLARIDYKVNVVEIYSYDKEGISILEKVVSVFKLKSIDIEGK